MANNTESRRPLQILNILSKTNLSKNHNSISFSGRVHLPTVPHLQKSLHFPLRLILLILGVILGTGCACFVIHCSFKLHLQIINIQNTASVYTKCIHCFSEESHFPSINLIIKQSSRKIDSAGS